MSQRQDKLLRKQTFSTTLEFGICWSFFCVVAVAVSESQLTEILILKVPVGSKDITWEPETVGAYEVVSNISELLSQADCSIEADKQAELTSR